MSKIAVDKTYICHWNKLMDRKKILIENLSHLGLDNYEFVESYIAEELNEKEIKNEYPLIFQPTEKGRFLKMSEISLALKHYESIILYNVNYSDNNPDVYSKY